MSEKAGFVRVLGRHLRRARALAGAAVLLGLSLAPADLRAELLFRSLSVVNGQQTWSAVRKYSNLQDTVALRVPFGGRAAPAQEVRVLLSGEITAADVRSTTVMLDLLRSGRQKLAGNTVWLASNGGDIDAGMDLGRLLRQAGVSTLVGRNDQCLSACVFAFMGGERRSVAGRLGIHRPFFPFTQDTPDRPARFRHLQRVLKNYVEELDFPASLYEAVMLVPPETHRILEADDLKRFYLEGISPLSEDLLDAAAARRLNLSMADYLQHKAKAPPCSFFDAGQGRCEGRVLEASASAGTHNDFWTLREQSAAIAGSDTRMAQRAQ